MEGETVQSENLRARYPVSETFEPLDGFDVVRTPRRIVAYVVVKQPEHLEYDSSLRFYSWRRAGNQKPWKVDLARLDTRDWNFEKMLDSVRDLKTKYNIR